MRAAGLAEPRLGDAGIGRDTGRRLYRVGAEQLSCASQQGADLVELLLQCRISHVLTLPRALRTHNSLTAQVVGWVPVRLAGGGLRSDVGAPAPPESYPGITGDAGFQLSYRLHPLGDRRAVACRVVDGDGRNGNSR